MIYACSELRRHMQNIFLVRRPCCWTGRMPFRLPPRDPFGIALATWFNAVPHFVFVKTNVRAGGPNLAGSLSIRSGKHVADSHDQVTLLLRLRDDTDLSGGHQYVILRKRATGLYVVPAWREALSRATLQRTRSCRHAWLDCRRHQACRYSC